MSCYITWLSASCCGHSTSPPAAAHTQTCSLAGRLLPQKQLPSLMVCSVSSPHVLRSQATLVQGLAAARQAVGKYEASGTPWLRPPDYYAEMVKSDDHMQRVKAQLMHEQSTLEAAEERCVALLVLALAGGSSQKPARQACV